MTWGLVAVGAGTAISAYASSSAASNAADKQQQGTDKAIAASQAQYDQTRSDLAPYRTAGAAALSRLNALLGINDKPTTNPGNGATWGWLNGHDYTGGAGWLDSNGQPVAGTADNSGQNDPEFGSLLKKFSTSDLNADPVYNSGLQFGLDQGTKAINARATANGSYDSGATLKALTQYGNDYASTKAGDAYGRFTNDQNSQYQKLAGISGMGLSGAGATSSAGTGNASNLANLYSSQGNANAAASIAGSNAISSAINSNINNYNQSQLLKQLSPGGQRTLSSDPSLTNASDLFGNVG